MNKSSVEEIRQRFDGDVERFSNLETGQSATVDAPLAMTLVAQAAAATTPHATSVLDVGCGAGNYTLKLLQHVPNLNATLVDLSRPMLDRAVERISRATSGTVTPIQSDIRALDFPPQQFDIILSAAALHHLRTDTEWESVFIKLFQSLRKGGSFWIFDLIESSIPPIQAMMWQRYGEFLKGMKNETYRDEVFAYIEREDTPKPLMFQLDLMRKVGFAQVEVLHKNSCFAAFGGIKANR